jgi:hypothetical protein
MGAAFLGTGRASRTERDSSRSSERNWGTPLRISLRQRQTRRSVCLLDGPADQHPREDKASPARDGRKGKPEGLGRVEKQAGEKVGEQSKGKLQEHTNHEGRFKHGVDREATALDEALQVLLQGETEQRQERKSICGRAGLSASCPRLPCRQRDADEHKRNAEGGRELRPMEIPVPTSSQELMPLVRTGRYEPIRELVRRQPAAGEQWNEQEQRWEPGSHPGPIMPRDWPTRDPPPGGEPSPRTRLRLARFGPLPLTSG